MTSVVSFEQASEIFKAAGLVAARLWAAWTFQRLQKTQAAELENNKRRAETQKNLAELEEIRFRQLSQEEMVAISIEIEPSILPGNSHILSIAASIRNEGQRPFWMEFDNFTLSVGRVAFDAGNYDITDVRTFTPLMLADGTKRPLDTRGFKVCASRRMALAVVPVEVGVYFVQFKSVYYRVPLAGEEIEPEFTKVPIYAIEQKFYTITDTK